jgi:hypothetical protein
MPCGLGLYRLNLNPRIAWCVNFEILVFGLDLDSRRFDFFAYKSVDYLILFVKIRIFGVP